MMRKTTFNDKKNGFLAQKEKILQEIKYYEERIADFPRTNLNDYYNEICSSDSEDDFPSTLDIGPSISELKHQERLLRTCLQATQELTSVGVLQSEVNVMVQDPPIEGEKPVTEPGSWREVTAECRIDLIPFSLTFYTHQPSRKFASSSYRGLRVLPVKTSNEAELSKSVLSGLTSPSDAIEVLRSYAIAYRSRRTTLARLADRYAASLSMEPLSEGGFVLKCANLLKMSWRLENQVSPVAPFHHKMNFDLEYMDNSYLKIIKQAHRQLSDPSLQTDERTLLLAKIISTCLEAQAPTQELYESMESDPESIKKLEKTILEDSEDDGTDREDPSQAHKRKRDGKNALESTDDEVTERDTESRKRKRDEEVMAPPKSIPKKTKPKGKENMDDNRKPVKRGNQADGGNAKKAKTDVQNSGTDTENFNVAEMVKQAESAKNNGNKTKKVAPNQKNTVKVVGKEVNEKEARKEDKKSQNLEKTVGNPKNSDNEATKVKKKVTADDKIAKNDAKEPKVPQDNAKSEDNVKKVAKKAAATTDQVKSNEKNNDQDKKKVKNEKKTTKASVDPKSDKNTKDAEENAPKNTKTSKTGNSNVDKNAKTNENIEKKLKNYEKTTASSQAKAKTAEYKVQLSKNSEKVKTVNEKVKTVNPNNTQNTQNAKSSDDKKVNSKFANELQNNPKNTQQTQNAKSSDNKKVNSKSTANELQKAKINVNSEPTKAKNGNTVTTSAKIADSDPATNQNGDTKKVSKINESAKNKDTTEKTRIKDSAKNKDSEEKTRVNPKNDPKPTKNIDKNNATENIDNDKIKNVATKKDSNTKRPTKNPAKIPKTHKSTEKSKIVIKNHRNSGGKMPKKSISINMKTDNSNEGVKISKIPQKKLSPAYAAALEQLNPIRVSPRMMSKLKSISDSNIRSKIFKTVTNIPRLKKPSTIV